MAATSAQVRLTEEQNELIFRQQVLPNYIRAEQGRALPSSREAVVLGGQPGSGKTGQLHASADELRSRGATWVINGDDFYAYHPAYASLQRTHGAEAAHMVKEEARQWVTKTIGAAQERGVNIVLESTMRQPEVVQASMQGLRDSGYSVHAKVLAVKEQASWQGNHMRFETLSLQGGYPRLTSRDTHDAGVGGVVKTVGLIERKQLADHLTVHKRNGEVIHDSSKQQTKATDAISQERARPWSKAEIAQHTKNWHAVEALAVKRHEREKTTPKRSAQELTAIGTQRNADERTLTNERTQKQQAKDQERER